MKKLVITPKPLKGEDGYRTFSIRVREETVTRLEELAKKTGRSRNELIGLFLEFAMENCVIEQEEP